MSKKSKHDYDYEPHPADAPAADPAADLPPPEQRVRELLTALTDAQRHNAPVTMWMLNELRELISHFTGEHIGKPLHAITDSRGQPGTVTVKMPDGSVNVIDTVEEALTYVRTLPVETQKRPHWRAADKLLAEACNFIHGADVSPAIRQFESAIQADRAIDPPRVVDVPARDPSLEPPPPAPAAEPAPEPAHV